MEFVRQSLFVLLSMGLPVLLKSIFSNIVFFILGSLVILYLVFANRKKIVPQQRDPAIGRKNFNLLILIGIVLVLIFSTGEISSPFFFLLYFLTFAVAFVLDPKVVFVFTAGLIVLFFPSTLKTDLTRNLIMLFSLFLLSPLAFFAGTDYQKKRESRRKIEDMKIKAQVIERDIENVLSDNKQILNKRTANKLSKTLLEKDL